MPAVTTPTKTIDLIGAPTDVGAAHRGASMGPEAMRVAGIYQNLVAVGLTVADLGNLAGPPNPWLPPVDGYRHLAEVTAWNEAVHEAVHASLSRGHLPILLGGDHCLAIGSISAVSRFCRESGKRLRVLWLDAHADFNTTGTSPTGNIHGMPVAVLRGRGPDQLTGLGGHHPAIEAGTVRQVGIRSVDAEEKRLVHADGMQVYDMRHIDEHGMRMALSRALDGLDADTHLHVSFDVDFLDPEIAPGVGTTVNGGPTYREAQLCMELIADSGLVGSVDVMELNPACDIANKTAEVAVDLIESLFGKSTLLRLKGMPAG
jgi:arginase